MKALLLIAVSLAAGYGLGATPVVNENLHWNLWFIVPVSGLILGLLLGWLNFKGAYMLNLNVNGGTAWLLGLGAAGAYLMTEFGIYNTLMIPVAGVEGLVDGEYKLSALFTFQDYIAITLESSAYDGKGGTEFEIGGWATELTYGVDILACFFAAFGTQRLQVAKYPFCERCERYKMRDTVFEALMPSGDAAQQAFENLMRLLENRNYQQVVSFLKDLTMKSDSEGDIKITADQRFCTECKEASIIGRVFQNDGKDWKEVDDLAFQFDSKPGEHAVIG